jgi:hypothetical protein
MHQPSQPGVETLQSLHEVLLCGISRPVTRVCVTRRLVSLAHPIQRKRLTATTGSKLDIPRKQFVDALGRVSSDAGDEGAEIRLGVDAVELGGFDDGVHDGGAFPAAIGTGEGPVPAAKCQRPDGTFSGIVADIEASVGGIAHQGVLCLTPQKGIVRQFTRLWGCLRSPDRWFSD